MKLFIRTREIRTVERKVLGRRGGAIVLAGPRGSGRSALLRALSASVSLPIVSVRGSEVESSWPKSGLIAFLASLDATLGTNGEASVAELLRHGGSDSPHGISKVIEGELRAGQCGDFLVLIDDIDLLDSSSQTALGTAAKRLSSLGMRCVFTMSTASSAGAFPDIPKLALGPVDTQGLIQLGRSLTPPSASETVLEHVARASAGSPLALKSILSALPDPVVMGERPIPSPITTGRALDEVNLHGLKDLDDSELVSIQYLACADYLPVSIFRRLADSSIEALDTLQAAGLVQREEDRLFISTQALSASVYWAMGGRRRIQLHEEILEACSGDHAGLNAWHSSFLRPDPGQSRHLLEAALGETAAGRIRPAVAFAERAVSLGDPESWATYLPRLSKLMLRNGQFNLARRYLQFVGVAEGSHMPHPSIAFMTVILDYVQHQRLSTQVFIPTVREHAEASPVDCARFLGVGAICHLERWEVPEAQKLIDKARRILPEQNDFLEAVETLSNLYESALSGGELPSIAGLSQQVSTIRRGIGPETAQIFVARALSLAERHADARALLREFMTPARCGHRIWSLFALQVAFSNEVRAGRYDRARAVFELFDTAFREQRHFEVNHSYGASLFAMLDGDLETAACEVRRARLLVPPGTGAAQEAQISVRQARVAMAQRDVELAADHYRRARNIAVKLTNPSLLRFHGDYALVLARLNRPEAAREALEEFRRLNDAFPSSWTTRSIALCEAMLTPGEEGLQAFGELLRAWDGEHHEYLRARALFAYSDALGRLGYSSESERTSSIAAEVFREIGIDLGDETCATPDEDVESASVLELLSEKELAVVRLLARGAKNQAIAHELYVSVRTVELRLTNIFRKVGVKSRFDLIKRVTPELEAQGGLDPGSPPSTSRLHR